MDAAIVPGSPVCSKPRNYESIGNDKSISMLYHGFQQPTDIVGTE